MISKALDLFPEWFKRIPHLFIALVLFFVMLGVWIPTRDRDVFQMVVGLFGAILGMLTGRPLANPQPPPTDETVNLTVTRHNDPTGDTNVSSNT